MKERYFDSSLRHFDPQHFGEEAGLLVRQGCCYENVAIQQPCVVFHGSTATVLIR